MLKKTDPNFKEDLFTNLFKLAYASGTKVGKAYLINYMSQVQYVTTLTFQQQADIVKERSLAAHDVIVDVIKEMAH